MVELDRVSHVAFEGLSWELGGDDGVTLSDGDGCLLAGCTVGRMAGDGAVIHGGRACGLLSCDIFAWAGAARPSAGGDRNTLTPGGHFLSKTAASTTSRGSTTRTRRRCW